jgi:hypothetical protein
MTNTFHLSFLTDADRNRSLLIRDAKDDVATDDFLIHVGKILDSEIFNTPEASVTGIRKGELITQTRRRYV